jgi:hypothetical protein
MSPTEAEGSVASRQTTFNWCDVKDFREGQKEATKNKYKLEVNFRNALCLS